MRHTPRILTLAAVAMIAWPRAHASQPCNRQCIREALDTFMSSLAAHDPTRLRWAPDARVTENGRDTRPGDGIWKTAGAVGTYRIYVIDPDTVGGAIQTTLQKGDSLLQIQVRLKMGSAGITEAEILIAREGETCCWAPQALASLSRAYEEPVRSTERMTREQMVAAADAYFSALHNASKPEYRRPPVTAEMLRYENGLQTSNANFGPPIIRMNAIAQLDSGVFGRIGVVNRRYPVVDVVNGTLLGVVVFDHTADGRPHTIISEFFKMSGGKITEIRAVMVPNPTTGWR